VNGKEGAFTNQLEIIRGREGFRLISSDIKSSYPSDPKKPGDQQRD
jgi:hypothetical protein